MDLNRLPLFSMITKRASWLDKRQEVLARNIANADTPDFMPRDLKAQNFRSLLTGPTKPEIGLVQTSTTHIGPTKPPRSPWASEKAKETYETAPDGNAVVLDEQLMKVSETQADHRLALNLYSKHVAMLKAVLGRDRA
jgi:flagellar basal-body rod protein FlgB